jgi:hypothetical protein
MRLPPETAVNEIQSTAKNANRGYNALVLQTFPAHQALGEHTFHVQIYRPPD